MNSSWLVIRRASLAVSILLLAMLILWWALWSIAATQYRNVIDSWIETEKSIGHQFDYDDRWTTGFPHRVALHFMNVRWQNADGIRMHADEATLSAIPWEWRIFDAKFKYGVEVSVPFEDQILLTFTGTSGHGHAELDSDNQWRIGGLELVNVKAFRKNRGSKPN